MNGNTKFWGYTLKSHTIDAVVYEVRRGGIKDVDVAINQAYLQGTVAQQGSACAAISVYIGTMTTSQYHALVKSVAAIINAHKRSDATSERLAAIMQA